MLPAAPATVPVPAEPPGLGALWTCWPGAVFRLDADFRWTWLSDSIEALTGRSARAWLAEPAVIERAVHPLDRACHAAHWRSLAQHADGASFRFRLLHAKTGSVMWVDEFSMPEFDAAGNIRGFVGVWMDETRATRLERRVIDGAWSATLAAMTSGMVHNFNNILTGMISVSEHLLGQLPADHPFRESLALLHDNGLGASRWIQRFGLLHQSGPVTATWHDANDLLSDTLEILRHVLSRRFELSAQCADGPVPIMVGAAEFQRVLLMLVFRAASRMSRPGRIRLKVSGHSAERAARGEQVSVGVETSAEFNEPASAGEVDAVIGAAARFAARCGGGIEVDSRTVDRVTTWLHFPAANAEAAGIRSAELKAQRWVLLGGGAPAQVDVWADWLRKHSYLVTVAGEPDPEVLDGDDYRWTVAVIVIDAAATGATAKLLTWIRTARPDLPVITVLPDCAEFEGEAQFSQATTLVAAGDDQRDRLLAKLASVSGAD